MSRAVGGFRLTESRGSDVQVPLEHVDAGLSVLLQNRVDGPETVPCSLRDLADALGKLADLGAPEPPKPEPVQHPPCAGTQATCCAGSAVSRRKSPSVASSPGRSRQETEPTARLAPI
jgi:hypothetical protein